MSWAEQGKIDHVCSHKRDSKYLREVEVIPIRDGRVVGIDVGDSRRGVSFVKNLGRGKIGVLGDDVAQESVYLAFGSHVVYFQARSRLYDGVTWNASWIVNACAHGCGNSGVRHVSGLLRERF